MIWPGRGEEDDLPGPFVATPVDPVVGERSLADTVSRDQKAAITSWPISLSRLTTEEEL